MCLFYPKKVILIRTLGEHTTKASHCDWRAQGLTNPSPESHAFDVGFKSHTLQLDPNIPPRSAAPTPTRATYALVPGEHCNAGVTTRAALLQLRDMVEGSDTN